MVAMLVMNREIQRGVRALCGSVSNESEEKRARKDLALFFVPGQPISHFLCY